MKLYEVEKGKLKKVFRDGGMRISLMTDTWTSVQNLNYMCLTAHFIDKNWKLQKKIINFCLIPNHRGDAIGRYVESCLLNWGIDRIFTVTVDNASSNDTAISYLKQFLTGNLLGGKYMHMRCCAHILNLIVSEGLKECNDAITMVRNAVRYVHLSPARLEKFKRYAEKEKIDCKKMLYLDVQTRWNSTYLMLEAAEKFEKAFRQMESADYKSMAINMRTKYDKYWVSLDRMNLFMLIAVVLDPRSKLGLLTFHLKKIHDEFRAEELVSNVRQVFADLYAEYNATFGSTTSTLVSQPPPTSRSMNEGDGKRETKWFKEWYRASSAMGSSITKTEVDRYLSDG
ncbi:hypothetical protein I3760_04G092600 [Carya illinoinensis]|nr:hypothetical protein I3760_04G092600 [Carya illinoinensis]